MKKTLRPKENLYTLTCTTCGGVFRSEKPKARTCPDCKLKKRRAAQRKYQEQLKAIKRQQREAATAGIPIREMTAIITRYNQAHGTSYTYGQFMNLLRWGKIKLKEDFLQ